MSPETLQGLRYVSQQMCMDFPDPKSDIKTILKFNTTVKLYLVVW